MRKPAPSARAMPARLGEIFLTGHLKNGAALCPDFNTGECRQDPCAREHLCAMLQQTGRACGGRRPASECRAKRRMTEAKLRKLGLPVPADPPRRGAIGGAGSEAPKDFATAAANRPGRAHVIQTVGRGAPRGRSSQPRCGGRGCGDMRSSCLGRYQAPGRTSRAPGQLLGDPGVPGFEPS